MIVAALLTSLFASGPAFAAPVAFLDFSDDGKVLATGAPGTPVTVWDASSGEALAVVETRTADQTMALWCMHLGETETLVTCNAAGGARVWNWKTGELLQDIDLPDRGSGDTRMVWEGEGAEFSVSGQNAERTRGLVANFDESGSPTGDFEIEARSIASLARAEGRVAIAHRGGLALYPPAGPATWSTSFENGIRSLVFASRNERLISGDFRGTWQVWDASSGERLLEGEHSGWLNGLALHSDQQRFATVGDSDEVMIWDLETGKLLQSLTDPERSPKVLPGFQSVAFSPDGQHIVAGTESGNTAGETVMWSLATEQVVRRFHSAKVVKGIRVALEGGHWNPVNGLDFSADSQTLATVARDATARLWDVASGRERVLVSPAHDLDRVPCVVLLSDDKMMTCGRNSPLRVRDRNGDLVQEIVIPNMFSGLTRLAWEDDESGFSVAASREVVHFDASGRRTGHMVTDEDRLDGLDRADGYTAVGYFSKGLAVYGPGGSKAWSAPDERWVTAVAFASGREKLVSGDSLGNWRVWDGTSGERLLEGMHAGWINAIAVHPDQRMFATVSHDFSVHLWDLSTGERLYTLFDPAEKNSGKTKEGVGYEALAFSPDGRFLAVGTGVFQAPGQALVWSLANRTLVRRFEGIPKASDPSDVAAKGVQIDVQAGHASPIRAIDFSADGQIIATVADDSSARQWDVATGRELLVIEEAHTHQERVTCVGLMNDESMMTCGNEGPVRIWDRSGVLVEEIEVPEGISGEVQVAWEGDKSAFVAAAAFDVVHFDATGNSTGKFDAEYLRIDASALSGGYTALGFYVHGLAVHAPDGELLWAGAGEDWITAVAFGRGHDRLVSGDFEGNWAVWDGNSGDLLLEGQHAGWVNAVAVHPDQEMFATVSHDFVVHLWDLDTGMLLYSLTDPTRKSTEKSNDGVGYEAVAFSPDGRFLAVGTGIWDGGGETLMWSLSSRNLVRRFRGTLKAKGLVTSEDGRWLVVSSTDGTARLWDLSIGQQVRRFVGHTDRVEALALSADGSLLVSGSWDYTARIWDVATGRQLAVLPEDDEFWISDVAISPGATRVATTAQFHSMRVWDAGTGELLAERKSEAFDPGEVVFVDEDHVWSAEGVWNYATGEMTSGERPAERDTTAAGDARFSLTEEGSVKVYDADRNHKLTLAMMDSDWAAFRPDGYYSVSRDAVNLISFRLDGQIVPFESFDLKYNRPDLVLEAFGTASEETLRGYSLAADKRQARMGFSEDTDNTALPKASIANALPVETPKTTITVDVTATDPSVPLDRLHVSVDDVPLFGVGGRSIRDNDARTLAASMDIDLSYGTNRIQVSVQNVDGLESPRQTALVDRSGKRPRATLKVLVVGVSDYPGEDFDLNYAAKDAGDIGAAFKKYADRFRKVEVVRLVDENATRADILAKRDFLAKTAVDDQVVVFFAGHGVVDGEGVYRFATHDADLSAGAVGGLTFEEIEQLVDAIPARRRMLLLDTCHSGEFDEDAVAAVADGNVRARAVRGLDVVRKDGSGNAMAFGLMRELFADVRRRTGAVVIAAAGGAEFAFEDEKWDNGVFTYALVNGLDGDADANGDGAILASELRDYVTTQVSALTGGLQTPMARQENLVLDFPVQ